MLQKSKIFWAPTWHHDQHDTVSEEFHTYKMGYSPKAAKEPSHGLVVIWTEFQVADCIFLVPDTPAWKTHWAREHACPESQKDGEIKEGIVWSFLWRRGCFLAFSLSGEHMHLLAFKKKATIQKYYVELPSGHVYMKYKWILCLDLNLIPK